MAELTKLKKEDFIKILGRYTIGKYKSHKHAWWALGNTVYFLRTTKGKYVLKIYGRSQRGRFEYILALMDWVNKKSKIVPEIIKDKRKKNSFFIRGRKAFIQTFVDGVEVKRLGDAKVKSIAKEMGRLGQILKEVPLKGKFTWGNHQFEQIKHGSRKLPLIDLSKEERELHSKLSNIDRKKLRKSAIHGDLHKIHFLIKNKRVVAIIDWDDAHEDYLIFEIAIFIGHSLVKRETIKKDKIKLFLQEYQRYITLNNEEKRALYYFILYRYLSSVSWVTMQKKKHADNIEKIDKWTNDFLTRYLAFKKMGIENFLELF